MMIEMTPHHTTDIEKGQEQEICKKIHENIKKIFCCFCEVFRDFFMKVLLVIAYIGGIVIGILILVGIGYGISKAITLVSNISSN
jgi:hypothetical protein